VSEKTLEIARRSGSHTGMNDPMFFGFGSLVNRATQNYPGAQHAWLSGWRREWVKPNFRKLTFLSVRPDPLCEIAGLAARVPGADWTALDEREAYYARHPVALRTASGPIDAQVYAVEKQYETEGQDGHAILLSYLDVVLQGYLREFGEQGVADFIDTTDGWETPVLDDRHAPIYPRAQSLSNAERGLVDDHLAALGMPRLGIDAVEL